MKLLAVILLVAFTGCYGYSYTIPANTKNPGICYWSGHILTKGDNQLPSTCQNMRCNEDGSILVQGCGHLNLPDCQVEEQANSKTNWPDCCEMTYRCTDEKGNTIQKRWNRMQVEELERQQKEIKDRLKQEEKTQRRQEMQRLFGEDQEQSNLSNNRNIQDTRGTVAGLLGTQSQQQRNRYGIQDQEETPLGGWGQQFFVIPGNNQQSQRQGNQKSYRNQIRSNQDSSEEKSGYFQNRQGRQGSQNRLGLLNQQGQWGNAQQNRLNRMNQNSRQSQLDKIQGLLGVPEPGQQDDLQNMQNQQSSQNILGMRGIQRQQGQNLDEYEFQNAQRQRIGLQGQVGNRKIDQGQLRQNQDLFNNQRRNILGLGNQNLDNDDANTFRGFRNQGRSSGLLGSDEQQKRQGLEGITSQGRRGQQRQQEEEDEEEMQNQQWSRNILGMRGIQNQQGQNLDEYEFQNAQRQRIGLQGQAGNQKIYQGQLRQGQDLFNNQRRNILGPGNQNLDNDDANTSQGFRNQGRSMVLLGSDEQQKRQGLEGITSQRRPGQQQEEEDEQEMQNQLGRRGKLIHVPLQKLPQNQNDWESEEQRILGGIRNQWRQQTFGTRNQQDSNSNPWNRKNINVLE